MVIAEYKMANPKPNIPKMVMTRIGTEEKEKMPKQKKEYSFCCN